MSCCSGMPQAQEALLALDPRTKLAWFFLVSSAPFLTQSRIAIASLLGVVLAVGFFSGVGPREMWNRIRLLPVAIAIAYTGAFALLMLPDPGLGAVEGLWFSIKLNTLLFAGVILASTLSPRQMCLALTQSRIPYSFAIMIVIAFRFLPLIRDEARAVKETQLSRGLDPQISPFHPIRSYGRLLPLVMPIIYGLFQRSWELALSLEIRGLRNSRRHRKRTLRFSALDAAMMVIGIGVLVAAMYSHGIR